MDDVQLKKIGAFEAALQDAMKTRYPELMSALDGGDWDDGLEQQLKAAVAEFKTSGSW
jgi:F-type H+-transporting ATPase subunit alpha